MEIISITLKGNYLDIIYRFNGIRIKSSSIANTKEDVIDTINSLIKNPTI